MLRAGPNGSIFLLVLQLYENTPLEYSLWGMTMTFHRFTLESDEMKGKAE